MERANDPALWRALAEESRATANATIDVRCRLTLLRIADDYDRLAERSAVWAAQGHSG
jgi:hypothetical protein